ncbi:MAG: O-antigen ligase family protein [Alphaproteobacteria bacterium]|nr:O-antigen ligase family protein [Alphaproteobacteria bacterium]
MKISLAWKFLLIVGLAGYISMRKVEAPWFVILSYIYLIKSVLVVGIIEYPVKTILPIIGGLTLPIIYQGLQTYLISKPLPELNGRYHKLNYSRLNAVEKNFKYLVIFLALSCLPFWLGLEPLVMVKTLNSFGFEAQRFVGLFQNIHNAAGGLAVAAVSLLYLAKFETKKSVKYLLYICFFIATIGMLQTFVRTGLLMFVVGMLVINFAEMKRNFGRVLFLSGLLVVVLWLGVFNSDEYMARIFDTRTIAGFGDYRDIGSGRFLIWETNLRTIFSQDLWGVLIGLGIGLSGTIMYQEIGLEVFSHNGFVDALVQSGVIGLFLFILYLSSIFKYINRFRGNKYYTLSISYFCMYIAFQLVQGSNQFLVMSLFSFLLILLKYTPQLAHHNSMPMSGK